MSDNTDTADRHVITLAQAENIEQYLARQDGTVAIAIALEGEHTGDLLDVTDRLPEGIAEPTATVDPRDQITYWDGEAVTLPLRQDRIRRGMRLSVQHDSQHIDARLIRDLTARAAAAGKKVALIGAVIIDIDTGTEDRDSAWALLTNDLA